MIERCRSCGVDWETLEHPYEGLNCIDCRYLYGESEFNFWVPGRPPAGVTKVHERMRQVAVMRRRNLTNNQISRRVGMSERNIWRLAQRWQELTGEVLPTRSTRLVSHPRLSNGRYAPRDLDGELGQKILELRRAGTSHDGIARRVNVSIGTIKNYIRDYRKRGDL